jgi:hypothetical protein
MSTSVRVSAADREAARALLHGLSDFSTASDALARLFDGLDDAPAAACERRFCVAAQLLRWQNLPAAAISLVDAMADFADDDGGDREVVVTRGMVLTAMGKPALLFATSIYDDALAELVWAGLLALRRRLGTALDLTRHALDNASDAHGYSALHYALEAQMHALALRVWRDLTQASSDQEEHDAETAASAGSATNAVAQLVAHVVTQDVALPAGKQQIQGRNVSSGGATLLHFAARVDAPEELVRALLEGAPQAVAAAEDWDGNSAYRVALMHGNRSLAELLRVRPLASP